MFYYLAFVEAVTLEFFEHAPVIVVVHSLLHYVPMLTLRIGQIHEMSSGVWVSHQPPSICWV